MTPSIEQLREAQKNVGETCLDNADGSWGPPALFFDNREQLLIYEQAIEMLLELMEGKHPTHWMAPNELTEDMLFNGARALDGLGGLMMNKERVEKIFKSIRSALTQQPEQGKALEDLETLRWLLNVSQEYDRPNMRLTTALDKVSNSAGETNREILERLYKTAKAFFQPPPPDERMEGLDEVTKYLTGKLKVIEGYGDPYEISEDPEEFGGTDDGAETVAMAYENLQGEAVATIKKTITILEARAHRHADVREGYALVKLGRFHPTTFSPVTFIEKTHPDRIRVDCRGEEGSYSFALPIAAPAQTDKVGE